MSAARMDIHALGRREEFAVQLTEAAEAVVVRAFGALAGVDSLLGDD
jgi:hypothetical protein